MFTVHIKLIDNEVMLDIICVDQRDLDDVPGIGGKSRAVLAIDVTSLPDVNQQPGISAGDERVLNIRFSQLIIMII